MSAPRFAPVVDPRPPRTVNAYRARKAQAVKQATTEALRRHVAKIKGERE